MVTNGNATVMITNMDDAIAFYTGTLGMSLKEHYGDHWATVEAGGFTIGLHPKSEKGLPPGTGGSISIGLLVPDIVSGGEALRTGSAKGIRPVEIGSGGSFIHFQDPDGNHLYLWQMSNMD